jgi:hypothetical protein
MRVECVLHFVFHRYSEGVTNAVFILSRYNCYGYASNFFRCISFLNKPSFFITVFFFNIAFTQSSTRLEGSGTFSTHTSLLPGPPMSTATRKSALCSSRQRYSESTTARKALKSSQKGALDRCVNVGCPWMCLRHTKCFSISVLLFFTACVCVCVFFFLNNWYDQANMIN